MRYVFLTVFVVTLWVMTWGCGAPPQSDEEVVRLTCWQAGQKAIEATAPRRIWKDVTIEQKDGICFKQVVRGPVEPQPTVTSTPTASEPSPTATKGK